MLSDSSVSQYDVPLDSSIYIFIYFILPLYKNIADCVISSEVLAVCSITIVVYN